VTHKKTKINFINSESYSVDIMGYNTQFFLFRQLMSWWN